MSFELKKMKISEIGEVLTGKTPSSKESAIFKGKYLFITPRDMSINKYIRTTERTVSQKVIEKFKGVTFTGKSICVSCIGSDMGKVVFVDSDLPSLTNQQINTITNFNMNISPEYIYYKLKPLKAFFHQIAGGSTMPILNKSDFQNIELDIPPISIQTNIAAILSALDDKIELNNSINKILEEMAQALFKRWFIDFEFPNENGEPYKSSGGEFKECELGLIPKGWRVGSIGEVSDVNLESYSGKEKWNYINYLDTGNITRNRISNIQPLDCKLDKIPSRAKRKVNPNDIVISTVRPNQHHYGMIREPLENMLVSTGFAVITSNRNFPSDLLYLWLTQEDITQKLQSIAEGSTTTYPSIKPADIQTLKIPIPHDQILKELSSVIEAMHKKMWEIQKQNRVLTEIRDTLLPKLMSGEIRVPIDEQELTSINE
ncbi:restriction endonuclease subunit S [Paenibacillus sp. p3-SID867]|uniref:restriction endonuclease subunit S n=1 Tax=Paenibacillus sp. p3-SID867 TaxID=2916363 RepID=UPI0021A8F396|nr:restriction endonuclease subunit S [Paenibacillus sp. p3-SID867]MCT1398488.1 restriction endonuclease subunit S [Paenibacillus sp. p3-SID867]